MMDSQYRSSLAEMPGLEGSYVFDISRLEQTDGFSVKHSLTIHQFDYVAQRFIDGNAAFFRGAERASI
ncbi:MAG TPA: hypothetical protein VK638_43840 [Edaphobacter sp.]|nr:hypothetical protein [Edaphobacter sp.]